MTREKARIIVEQLDNYLSHTCQDYGERDHEAMMTAIKALEQESYEDAAKRQTAIDLVNSNMTFDEFESPTKKTKFHISDMDITFDKPLYQEEMEHLFFDALHSIGVKGHRGCPD